MTREVIRDVINEFLGSDEPEVLAISGQWGVGKTYALQELVREFEGTGSLSRYAYVSAFGAKSIGELRSMILLKSRPFPIQGKVESAAKGVEKIFSKGRGFAFYKAATAWLEKLPNGGKHVTVLLETLATSLISRTVVCIDDIERLGSAIEMNELMGLVSELKSESSCKIILLFNEEQLVDKREQYEISSEKVIDKKLIFETTTEEAIALGLPLDTPLRDIATEFIVTLGIKNIRTIQKITNGLRLVDSVVSANSKLVKRQASVAVVIFAASLYERGVGFPSPDELSEYNWYSSKTRGDTDEERSVWWDLIYACGFLSCDAFDLEVLNVLRKGYTNGSTLPEYAASLDAVADRSNLEAIFNSVWEKFHYRFDGTAEELVSEFVDAIKVAAKVISPLNLNSTISLIRELGFETQAGEALESYIEANRGTIDLFRIDDSRWGRDVDDPTVRKRFAEVVDDDEGALELRAAAAQLMEERSADERVIAALLSASPKDFEELLRNNQGEGLWPLVEMLHRAAASRGDENQQIAKNLTLALQSIAAESHLNQVRAKTSRYMRQFATPVQLRREQTRANGTPPAPP